MGAQEELERIEGQVKEIQNRVVHYTHLQPHQCTCMLCDCLLESQVLEMEYLRCEKYMNCQLQHRCYTEDKGIKDARKRETEP